MLLAAPILLSLALLAQDCLHTTISTAEIRTEIHLGTVEALEAVTGVLLTNHDHHLWLPSPIVRHEADPPDPAALALGLPDTLGRRVRIEVPSYGPTTVTILSGANPRDFDFALMQARWIVGLDDQPGRPIRPGLEAIAVRGLGSGVYRQREAAQRVLIRAGARALPALVVAEKSRDLEVRTRVAAILRIIRDGE